MEAAQAKREAADKAVADRVAAGGAGETGDLVLLPAVPLFIDAAARVEVVLLFCCCCCC